MTILVNSVKNTLADTIQSFYTSPAGAGGTRIDAFTAANNTDSSKSYKAYIFDSSGAAIDAVVPMKIIVTDRFDVGASIVGQEIPAGGSLRMESSAASSISFRITGTEF